MQCGRRTNGYVALFVFAALVGLLGQTVVPWLSDQLNSPHLGFRFLVSDIDIYPSVVVALITFGNTEPKRAFWRVLVFFSGLCLGYYGYTAALAAYSALESGSAGYLANVLSSAKDALEYMAVALCAGAWGFAMQRSARRRLLYAAMLVPFIVITMACTYSNLVAEPPQILMAAVDILCLAGIFLCLPRKATSE